MAEEGKEDGPNRIMVFLRIRPEKKGEINPADGTSFLFDIQPDNKTCMVEGKPYNYDWIYNGEVDQNAIYERVAEPVINNVFKGYWGTCMVYGQTGTGKSFTMCNFNPKAEGIIPRAMRHIFEVIQSDTERVYTVCFSFIQIYLDKLQDLFNPEAAQELKLNRDKDGVNFPGVVEKVVRDGDHFRELYDDGHQHRVITATKMNPESSRGHAALFIQIKSVPRDDPSGENRNGKLFLIDLAGYERFSKTGVQEGIMAQEAKTINASLLALGNCVQALSEKSEHIPWRNAKLTRMLEDAIGGKAKCSIILTAGPSSDHIHESLGTLYFGSRAMAVKTNAKLAVNIDYKKLAAKLQEMLTSAEGKISTLEVEATRRQLEREEAEARFQAEWARVKKRQDDQLQSLLKDGASPEKIQALINANQQENELLEEQHYQERATLEERHEVEVKETMVKQQEMLSKQSEAATTGMSRDMHQLQRELATEREEKERFKVRAQDAETEARRLTIELNDARMALERAGVDVPNTGDKAEIRKVFDSKIEVVKQMVEENYALKLQEVEEPLRDEMRKYQNLYETLKGKVDEDLQNQKDALTSMYEKEIEDIRRTSHDVQEKLKKNHLTIKKSYQIQKENLEKENDELTSTVNALTKQLQSAGMTPVAVKPVSAPRPSSGSSDEAIKEMRSEIEYLQVEKEGLQKQLRDLTMTKNGEERMNPAQIRQMKSELEELKTNKEKIELELFKIKAQQALSGPEQVTSAANDEDENDTVEDIHGDIEGMGTFVKKLMRTPHFVGVKPTVNTHQNVLASLTTDLDEYRRLLKYKLIFMGDSNTGKTSFGKCLTASSIPMIRNLPDVLPTVHPSTQPVSIEDPFVGKSDWHRLYVQFQDVEETTQGKGGMFGGLLGSKNTADPARLHFDIVDLPGDRSFWRGIPPRLLPAKGAVYCIMYDLTQPVDIARQSIEAQLTILQACCVRNYPKAIGGDTPRLGFCLIGTHKDLMRDSRESTVQSHLNRVTLSLGEVFYKLRGDDSYGLICVGNFAVSCKDWSVVGNKEKAPRSFKDLAVFLGTVACQLYDNRPTSFLSLSKEAVSHMNYIMGDELMEGKTEQTSHLDPIQQRLRKGVVTLLSGLHREQKVRWFMQESELRKLAAEHLNVSETDNFGLANINYLIRELCARCVIMCLPGCINDPKYLPRADPGERPSLAREGIVVLEVNRLMLMYSIFMCPTTISRFPSNAPILKDRSTLMVDYKLLSKCPPVYKDGIITDQLATSSFQRMLSLTCNEPRLLFELFSILGMGLNLRAETSLLSPPHFSRKMSMLWTEYLPYLINNFGDGLGRKYKLNAACESFFTSLQTKLIPFSHAPCHDANLNMFNFFDASFLKIEKNRLKWGIFGSKALKDAVMAAGVPVRGIMKMEEANVYIAITAQGKDMNSSIAVCRNIMNAIHYEISSLCSRDFRGMRATYQEMTLAGVEEKRKKLHIGIPAILTRFQISKDAIAKQLSIIGNLTSDPHHNEIEEALLVLPKSELE